MIPLDDMTEQELKDLIEAIRSTGGKYRDMDDTNVLAEVIRGKISYQYIASHSTDKKALANVVGRDWQMLAHVPDERRNKDICLAATRNHGLAMQYVPEPFMDREMCLEAVKNSGMALRWVPWRLRDREICMEAVRNWGHAIDNVPKHVMNNEMLLMASRCGWAMGGVRSVEWLTGTAMEPIADPGGDDA